MNSFTKLGNPDRALVYQAKFFELNDSLNSTEYFRIANDHTTLERDRDKKQITRMESSISKQRLSIYIVIVLLLVFIIIVFFLIWRGRLLRRNYMELSRRNLELVEVENKYRELLKQKRSDAIAGESASVGKQCDSGKDDGDNAMIHDLAERITALMEDSNVYCDPDFSLARLAELVGSNTKYVSLAINNVFGKNFRTYVNDFRIKEARRRLTDRETYGNYTIQGISNSVGIKSASSFIALFKSLTGVTPSIYLKMIKEEKFL